MRILDLRITFTFLNYTILIIKPNNMQIIILNIIDYKSVLFSYIFIIMLY